MSYESRSWGAELKLAGADDATMTFEGYGAYFGNVDSYGDVIEKGAFARSLKESKRSGIYPAMLLQHGSFLGGDDNMPVGVWTSMSEDEKGLVVEGRLAATQRGKDAYELLKMKPRPAITGLSIGFRVKKFELGTKPNEPRRKLQDIDLMEVSLVTFPANDKARITGVKSIDARGLERALQAELKLSQRVAVSAVALMKRHLREGEPETTSEGREGPDLNQLAERLRRNIATMQG